MPIKFFCTLVEQFFGNSNQQQFKRCMEKITIKTDEGLSVEAGAPIIISASRSTDIPAFYADWFLDRLQKGYSDAVI